MGTARRVHAAGWLVAALALASSACVDIDGGAVDLSWSLFAFGGDRVSCDEAEVAAVELCWRAVPAGGTLEASCADADHLGFACDDNHGTTRFDLPAGRTAFWLEPVCRDGEPAATGTYQVPAPIVREVVDGEVVTLSSLAIIVSDNSENPPNCGPTGVCTCQR
jgi:hypothetical protein